MMYRPQSIFDGLGVYEYSGMGQEGAPMLNCPEGQIGSPALGIPCQPIPGMSQASPAQTSGLCPAGQIGWPALGIPCIAVPGQPQTQPAEMLNPCGPTQIGWPSFGIPCMSVVLPGPCPPGTFGIPPNCLPIPSAPQPAPEPAPPPPATVPPPPPTGITKSEVSATEKWILPVAIGVGAVALIAVLASKPKKASMNLKRIFR